MSATTPDVYLLLFSRVIQGISVAILLIIIYMFVVNQIFEENVGSALFVKVEIHNSNTIFNLNLFRDFKYMVGNYAAFIAYFINFISTYILNFHLQYVFGFDSRIAGIILLSTP